MNRVERVRAGETASIARMISRIERRSDGVADELAQLHRAGGHAHIIGVTGAAGSGKSTLVGELTAHYRRAGRTVGVLAVDPSSVFSGGAILGDRIRMSALSGDDGVFIRSIATRGALGGLSRAALDAITVLDAAGKDVIVLETVGVGQAEVDVISAAQTVAVVSVPGMGDDVQAIKAGLLEIADVHVLNKADRDGAQKAYAELRDMLRFAPRTDWEVPIQRTVAATGEGVEELATRFDEHHEWMSRTGELNRRARRTAATRIRWMAEEIVLDRLRDGEPEFDREVDQVADMSTDPLHAAQRLIGAL
ncbi:methylmalonyl Co-A mutase-associated GTPase MeaB [Pseudonocardia spinosispora]|uniref:methylmalonyl Co-A mutase-associated GTPase MeaB n=1 Tax=Pseudonocardia spinosispora TaxID=103441 RepID=UPI00048B80E5|nr:methylmalonyl Co-A mutase-associated GTPase MeaB [Pseudonocardia spinosispora]